MPHRCHATGCAREVPPRMFMCRSHWFSLPKPIRDAIWATYRPGQERDKLPSREYVENARTAIAYIEEKESRRAASAGDAAAGASPRSGQASGSRSENRTLAPAVAPKRDLLDGVPGMRG